MSPLVGYALIRGLGRRLETDIDLVLRVGYGTNGHVRDESLVVQVLRLLDLLVHFCVFLVLVFQSLGFILSSLLTINKINYLKHSFT